MTDQNDLRNQVTLLPCPFCGRHLQQPFLKNPEVYTHPENTDCFAGKAIVHPERYEQWNNRADTALAEMGGVRVKPLVWSIGSHKSDYGDHIAQSLLGDYSVRGVDGRGFTLWFRERCLGDKPHGVREMFPTIEAAKAAANEDNRARILAAIEPAPVNDDHDWPDIPDTPEQRELVAKHNAAIRAKYPNLREIESPKTSVREAARVLLDAMNSGLDAFDVDGDNELEGLATKWSGNRGDGVIQLEIAEEFMREALRAIAEGKDDG